MYKKEMAPEVPVVAIAQKGNFTNGNPEFATRHWPLLTALGERGVVAVALNGAKYRAEGRGFSRYFTLGEERLIAQEAPVAVNAAYDLTGGIGRFVPEVSALNPRALRDLAARKSDHAEVLRRNLGDVMPQTIAVPAVQSEIEAGIEAIETEIVVVKADKDPGKEQPMLIGTKDTVRRGIPSLLEATTPDKIVLIQEYMPEVDAGFPSELQFDGPAERERAQQEGRRELRVHVFDETPVAVTGRVGLKEGERGKWVHFRPDTIPSRVPKLGADVAKSLREEAEVTNSHLVVDLTPDGGRIVEVNGRNIGTMRPDPDRPAAQRVHEIVNNALADKLTDMAIRNRKEAS